MATSFSWSIKNFEVQKVDKGLTNVVLCVYWKRVGSRDDAEVTYNVSRDGCTLLDAPDFATFIPFSQITEATAIGWVEAALGSTGIQEIDFALNQSLDNKINPPVVVMAPPWV